MGSKVVGQTGMKAGVTKAYTLSTKRMEVENWRYCLKVLKWFMCLSEVRKAGGQKGRKVDVT